MEEISAAIGLLVWSDWLTMAILLVFIGLGVKRGWVTEVINLSFLIIAIFGAWLFYESISHLAIIRWILDSRQSQLAIAFGIIFVTVLMIKRLLYKLINVSSEIKNPCAFNKFFALLVLLTVNLFVSWCYTNSFAGFELMAYFIGDNALRVEVSFILVFTIITGAILLLKQAFSISFSSNESCFFESLFKVILGGLQNINALLNAGETTPMRKIGGAIIGLMRGFVLTIMVILVLQSIGFISKQVFWTESQNSFKAFQNIATSIRPELANHLLFIKKD